MRWSPFSWLVRAFRAAVRAEVEAYMRDRREALRSGPTDAELELIRASLGGMGLRVIHASELTSAEIVPFPSVQPNHSKPPPTAA